MTKVKICGLKTVEDAMFSHNAGADAIGFIIDVPVNTPRKITSQDARNIIAQLPPYALTVGVVMPSTINKALNIIDETRVSALQLHGNSPASMVREIKQKKNVNVIKTYSIDVDTEINAAIKAIGEYIEYGVDGILLDTKGEAGAGGTGRKHDWRKSREIKEVFTCPIILAGGLNPDNVSDAIRLVEPYAVDVASGIESSPGIKDHTKIQEFIKKVRYF